jgi:hypothetical protein
MNKTNLFLAVLGVGLSVGCAGTPAHAESIIRNYNGYRQWTRIQNPDVTVSGKKYPIYVYNGDTVYVRAGGCVQTGGRGKTWKRYVKWSLLNRLHFGQIRIPGVINSLTDFSDLPVNDDVWSQGFKVNTPPSNSIWLGYLDNNYRDNGYWGRDNGTDNQCKGVGNAYVDIWIERKR